MLNDLRLLKQYVEVIIRCLYVVTYLLYTE